MGKEQEREWAEAQKIAVSVDLVAAAQNQLKFLASVRYKSDCEKLFGKILGNHNIISSVQGTSRSKTEEIWNTMYPEEPYELDHNRDSQMSRKRMFKVSRPHVSDNQFLQEALARYKGFLHLIRMNRKKSIKLFCVPTYDVDLMWHSHQSHPVSYCNDLIKLVGTVLEHDDTDSDRTKGKKLDTGFSGITKQWEETFGLSYWKAGAMYRGTTPTPVTQIPFPFFNEGKKSHAPNDKLILLPEMKAVEVLLEFVEINNLPDTYKGNLCVSFSKKQPDMLFTTKKTLTILSESREKQVACFQCEPTGEFLFELMCHHPSSVPSRKLLKPFGSCSLSLQECWASGSQLFVKKLLSVVPVTGILASEPILLHVSLSFTPPTPAPQVFYMLESQSLFKGCTRFFPLSKIRKVKDAKDCAVDDDGYDVLSLQMRDYSKDITSTPALLKEVLHITDSGETHTLAEFHGKEWLIKGSHGSLKLHCTSGNDGHFFELLGHKMVRLYAGRKLDYEPKHCEMQKSEQDFMTAVEFSTEYPYGKAIALIDFKRGMLTVMEECMILSGITLVFILYNILRREGRFVAKVSCEDNMQDQATDSPSPTLDLKSPQLVVADLDARNAKQGLSQSGDMINSGACGSKCSGKCGGGYGDMANYGGGSGGNYGGGYGNMATCGECGGNCGAHCIETVDMAKCGGSCGGGKCGGGHGNFAKCGGCGGTCVDAVDMAIHD
ncbi:Glycine-rich domain-containing protein 1 [Bienertia sinuspersici]